MLSSSSIACASAIELSCTRAGYDVRATAESERPRHCVLWRFGSGVSVPNSRSDTATTQRGGFCAAALPWRYLDPTAPMLQVCASQGVPALTSRTGPSHVLYLEGGHCSWIRRRPVAHITHQRVETNQRKIRQCDRSEVAHNPGPPG